MNTRHGYARGKDERKVGLRPPIVLTTTDRDKLLALIRDLPASAHFQAAEFLREEVERADVATCDVLPTLVVRIGSDVKFIDHDDGRIHRVRVAFPEEGRGTRSVSVLSPVGSALIGLGPGQSIRWSDSAGERSLISRSLVTRVFHPYKGGVDEALIQDRRSRKLELRSRTCGWNDHQGLSQERAI
ncbi:MAG: GreA/GreB family elongation factor [Thermomicrobiales bacterium]